MVPHGHRKCTLHQQCANVLWKNSCIVESESDSVTLLINTSNIEIHLHRNKKGVECNYTCIQRTYQQSTPCWVNYLSYRLTSYYQLNRITNFCHTSREVKCCTTDQCTVVHQDSWNCHTWWIINHTSLSQDLYIIDVPCTQILCIWKLHNPIETEWRIAQTAPKSHIPHLI